MKCVKQGDEVRRVSDDRADELIKKGWKFCPKLEWKQFNNPKENENV